MKLKHIYKNLDHLFENALRIEVRENDRFVVFSDLHLGNGSKKDDFKTNAGLFTTTLQGYYFKNNYKLILNGDIEELQRHSYLKIRKTWPGIFDIFQQFNQREALFKTIGNHDMTFLLPDAPISDFPLHESLILETPFGEIFVFHGHQASANYHRINKWIGYSLKYLANPLGIKNYSVSHNSRKQFKLERRVYHYSSFRKRVSIIGHTHRPLFESLSKAERLKYKIEQLCRQYAQESDKSEMKQVKKIIKSHKKELQKIHKKNKYAGQGYNLYHSIFHIPSLFNAGCVVGKRGMTCIEITQQEIALVHWFDKNTSQKYLDRRGYDPERFEGTDYYRMVLNQEELDYIFTRINLLA